MTLETTNFAVLRCVTFFMLETANFVVLGFPAFSYFETTNFAVLRFQGFLILETAIFAVLTFPRIMAFDHLTQTVLNILTLSVTYESSVIAIFNPVLFKSI